MVIDLDGFDGAEQLYNAVDAVYRLKMSAKEAIELQTVGDLHRFIADKYRAKYTEGCLSFSVFYSLRRALMFVGVSRSAVKRNALLEIVMPLEDRIWTWATVQGEMGCKLPRLRYESEIENDIQMFGIFGLLLMFGGTGALAAQHGWPAFACVALGVFSYCVYTKLDSRDYIDRTLNLTMPSGFETIESAIETIVAWNYGNLALLTGKWNEKELFASLQTIISNVSELEPQQIEMQTRFAEVPYYE
ncbi:MAG: hypothetical protein IT342_27540 [Candidatus Melainabacteria bacterium]|nr:hypothetical protein [Candidatus Melainabacteria bacterium]